MRHAISRSTAAAAAVAAVEKLQDWIANARRRRGGGRWPTEVEREVRYKRLHSVPFPSTLCNRLPRFRSKGKVSIRPRTGEYEKTDLPWD